MNKKNVIFLGKTGAGKSSLINALFESAFKTDNAVSCTKEIQTLLYNNIEIIDTPGIAEDLDLDETYLHLYTNKIHGNSTIVWVFQADTRVYKVDQVALLKLKPAIPNTVRFFIALNQIDLLGETIWDAQQISPSPTQNEMIQEKVNDVFQKFLKVLQISQANIVPVSVTHGYNTNSLKQLITNE